MADTQNAVDGSGESTQREDTEAQEAMNAPAAEYNVDENSSAGADIAPEAESAPETKLDAAAGAVDQNGFPA